MSVALLREWRLPGCGDECRPGQHDPAAHEEFGARQERERNARPVVQTGPLVIDRRQRTVTVHGDPRRLRPREMRLLLALAERPGEVVSYEELGVLVLGADWAHVNRPVMVNALHTHRTRLRENLGAAGRLIATARDWGMRLAVEPSDA